MSNSSTSPNALLRLCCVITRADPEIAMQSNAFDRRTIITNALALLAVFCLESLLWSTVFASRLRLEAAVPLGMFVGFFIYLIDQGIGASDWTLRGILRQPIADPLNRRVTRAAVVGSRLLMAGWLAVISGDAITLWWYSPTLDGHLQAQRTQQNAVVQAEYDVQREIAAQPLMAAQKELDTAKEERDALRRRMESAQMERDEAARRASDARIEMGREDLGLDRAKGKGPRYHDAKRQAEEAAYLMAGAEATLSAAQARFAEIETRIQEIDQVVVDRTRDFEAKGLEIDARMQRDPRYRGAGVDYMGRRHALEELKRDPVTGNVTKGDALKFTGAVIILELTFIIMTQFGAPSSVYTLRLIARTRLEAQRVDAEFARSSAAIAQSDGDGGAPAQRQPGAENQGPPLEAALFAPPQAPQAENDLLKRQAPAADTTPGQRFDVIGGAPEERISIAEALANPSRYWVNQDRPSEIWDRRHRDALLAQSFDEAA